MRIRLTVRRHALPEVNIIWDLDVESKPTTSVLLESVNAVIPIESTEWGLEDYAVELRDRDNKGFELLHFQPLGSILKDDDSVLIRPLLTHDLKQRRLSGRHQISYDGKHLVDGIAFGRPRLKNPSDRPDINIPPRKRRRVLLLDPEEQDDEEDDEDFEPREGDDENEDASDSDGEILLLTNGEHENDETHDEGGAGDTPRPTPDPGRRAPFDANVRDVDTNINSQSEDEVTGGGDQPGQDSISSTSDESMDDELDDEDLDSELKELRNEMMGEDENDDLGIPQPVSSLADFRHLAKSPRTRLMDLDTLDKLARLGDAFPQASVGARELGLMNSGFNEELAYLRLRQDYNPSLSLKTMLQRHRLPLTQPSRLNNSVSYQAVDPSTGSMADSEDASDDDETTEPASWVSRFDHIGFPAGSISSGNGLSVMASIKHVHDGFVGTASTPKEFGSGERPSKKRKVGENGKSVSSPTHSEPSPSAQTPSISATRDLSSQPQTSSDESDESSSDSSTDSESSSDESSDCQISGGTQSLARAQAAKASVKPSKSKDNSDDSEDSTGSESSEDNDSDSESSSASSDSDSVSESSSSSDSGPEETSTQELPNKPTHSGNPQSASKEAALLSTSRQEHSSPLSASQEPSGSQSTAPGHGLHRTQKRNARRRAAMRAKKEATEQESGAAEVSTPPKGAGNSESEIEARKRALLESFSMVTPPPPDLKKSQSDSTKLGADVDGQSTTVDVSFASSKPTTTATVSFASVAPPGNATRVTKEGNRVAPDADNSWRDKIEYSAVECCHDEVVLSEPPFPFVQRWDQQQQGYDYKGQRGGRGKRAQRNQSQFYEEDGWTSGKKRKLDDLQEDSAQVSTLNYDDPSGYEAGPEESQAQMEADGAADESRIMKDGGSQFTDMDDLPSLPADLAALPLLQPGKAKAGMVITWKQYVLSSATNWQPEIVDMTAIVVNPNEDVTGLQVVLARRDLDIESQAKTYDDEGNRVYDRFEAIDVDEGDNFPESGYRVLAFADMMDPRIVQHPIQPKVTTTEPKEPREKEVGIEEGDTAMADASGADGTVIHNAWEGEDSSMVAEHVAATGLDKVGAEGGHNLSFSGATASRDVSEPAAVESRLHHETVLIEEKLPPSSSNSSISSGIRTNSQLHSAILHEASSRYGSIGAESPFPMGSVSPPGTSLPRRPAGLSVGVNDGVVDPTYSPSPRSHGAQANSHNKSPGNGNENSTPITSQHGESEDPGFNSVHTEPPQYGPQSSQDRLLVTSELSESFLGKPSRHSLDLDVDNMGDIVHDSFLSSAPGHGEVGSSVAPEHSTIPQAEETVVFQRDEIRAMASHSPPRVKTIAKIIGERSASPASESRELIQDSMGMIWNDDEPLEADAPHTGDSGPAKDMDVSISTERHHEISQLITNSGFRKGVSPTFEKRVRLQLTSPSLQLQEEAAAASSVASKGVSPIPSIIVPNSQPKLDPETHPPSGQSAWPVASDRNDTLNPPDDHISQADPPSPTTSLHSGRQLNPGLSFSSINDELLSDVNDSGSVVLGLPEPPSRRALSDSSDSARFFRGPSPPTKDAKIPKLDRYDNASGTDTDISIELPSLETLSQRSKLASQTPISPPARKRKTPVSEKLDVKSDFAKGAPNKITPSQKPIVASSRRRTSSVGVKYEPPNQPRRSPRSKKSTTSMNRPGTISPPQPRRKQTTQTSKPPFIIPAGSQVITLSSSPEPEFEEDYKDDSVGETYEEPRMATNVESRGGMRTRSHGNRYSLDLVWTRSHYPGKKENECERYSFFILYVFSNTFDFEPPDRKLHCGLLRDGHFTLQSHVPGCREVQLGDSRGLQNVGCYKGHAFFPEIPEDIVKTSNTLEDLYKINLTEVILSREAPDEASVFGRLVKAEPHDDEV
ncbi:hypothetical protein MKZ38_007979 [Zalerion maritima]|uniref:DUF7357 domain-containing protein n=1 Tax=Zalerion maritima TaxID=339359 RepID=A0AAD5WPE4_9PEZI|nr:hypothetical protein MKZ38_007979 [Zalerion maritima]